MGTLPKAPVVLREVVLPFVLHRLALTVVAGAATRFFPTKTGFHTHLAPFLDMWVRWDSVHYMRVASLGYGTESDAFFPLFPLLMRGLSAFLPLPLAGFAVANVAAIGAIVLLHRFVYVTLDAALARRAVFIAIVFPTSFFLSAVYAESTYLLFAIATVYAWSRHRRGWAALWLGLACLARPQGFVALTLPFLAGWLVRSRRLKEAPFFVFGAGIAAAVLIGIHALATGDPLGFLHAGTVQRLGVFHEAPSTGSPAFWLVLFDEGWSSNLVRRLLNWLAIALVIASAVHLMRRREIELSLLSILTLAVPFAFHASLLNSASMARYTLLAFPVFVTLARWLPEERNGRVLDVSFAMLQVILFSLFATWHWAE